MKAINRAFGLVIVALALVIVFCVSASAQKKNMISSMDRQQVVTNDGDTITYLAPAKSKDGFVYPELSAEQMAEAEQINVDTRGRNVDVLVNLAENRDKVGRYLDQKDSKFLADVSDCFLVQNAPCKSGVNYGSVSRFLEDEAGNLYFYNALTHTLHHAEYDGYVVPEVQMLTGFYIAPDAGVINYNGDWRAMAGARIGYNSKWFDIYGGIDFTSGVKNHDDINHGKVYDSKMYFARAMVRFDLSPKGCYYDKLTLNAGFGIMGERRQLAVDNLSGIAASLPANVHMEIEEGDGYTYHQGYSLIFHGCVELEWRVARTLRVKGGLFAGPGNEYYKDGAEPVKGKFVYGAQVSLSWFPFNAKQKHASVTDVAREYEVLPTYR